MSEQDWSVSETDVIASIRDLLDEDGDAMVATVVKVTGSAYRRPGAKMLVDQGGRGLGHITAGCLEDEVFSLADEVLAAGDPRIEVYDLMEDEDDVWGLGVGCNGIIHILLEPLDGTYRPLVDAYTANEPIGMLTVLSGDAPLGARAFYRDGAIERRSDDFPAWLADRIEGPAAELVEAGKSDTVSVGTADGTAEVFIDGIQPAPELVIFGSGHDIAPVVDIAKKNDFRVRVVAFRGAADLDSRFPHADEIERTSPAALADEIELGPHSHAVVMTHNFIDDRLALDGILATDAPYIGLMGPRERFEEMREEFEAEGRTFSQAELDRIYTPVGLDLGAGSPYGIATSIVAEVLAVWNGREPRHLKEREGPIHDRAELEATVDD